MSDPDRSTPALGRTPAAAKRRLGRRAIRTLAWTAGMIGFALPWAVFHAIAQPSGSTAPQLITVPPGSRVTIVKSPTGVVTGVTVVTPERFGTTNGAARSPIATTGGSTPPP